METKMTERADYITEALELIGIDLSAPKRIVQEVSGFTPIFDCVISQYHDETKAAVHGAMWRFCQMEDGVCKASLETIGEMIGVSPATVMRHAEELVKDGYFNDLTPDLRNKPHVYADGGKVVMKSKLAAGISQRNVGISERKASISQSQLNKDINKESNKTASPLSPEELAKAKKLVDAIIANSNGSHFEGREIFLPDHLPLVDWYHERTGQVCRKKDRNSWMKAVREWVDAGLTPDDLQAAYEVDIVWRKVISNPNELTSKAIALKAQKNTKLTDPARPEYKPYTPPVQTEELITNPKVKR